MKDNLPLKEKEVVRTCLRSFWRNHYEDKKYDPPLDREFEPKREENDETQLLEKKLDC